ncbi:MAG TPA: hypothetical protein VGG72_26115 [Bryobacteraceae bacterium]|jgi:hypothetical protein
MLAPTQGAAPSSFSGVQSNVSLYQDLLFEMQELRGRVYLEDGAIQPSQLQDGRHVLGIDEESWHLLILNERHQVRGCIRCRHHTPDVNPQELAVSNSALASAVEWRRPLENALSEEFEVARRRGCNLAEAGGLALDQEIRGTTAALRLVLAIYALTELLGGVVGLSTVTQRHCSASILRRIGGRPLESAGLQLPPYYDPVYDCQMEVMRFYSWDPNPRYRIWVDEIKAELGETCVLTRSSYRRHSAHAAHAAS